MNEAEVVAVLRCGSAGQKAEHKPSVPTEYVHTTSSFDNGAHANWAKNHVGVP